MKTAAKYCQIPPRNGAIMDFREINTFIHVANQESFSKAADVLGYTQAAVTIQIKQLDSELDTRLFDRIGKHISLTHQGKIFYQYALHITNEIEEVKDVLSGSQDLNGTLWIGTIESICASILPDILSRYHQLHPMVEISIITDSPEALLDMMNKSRVDLVYFMDKRMYDPKWVKILEEPENIIFVGSQDHPCTKKGPLTLNEIIKEPFILTEKDASYRFILDQYLAAYGQEIHPRVESSSTDFIIQLLLKNEFLSFVPQFTVQEQIARGMLTPIAVQDFDMHIWRQIVYHKDKLLTREMKAFFQLVKEVSSDLQHL